jgi:hypothetical protein
MIIMFFKKFLCFFGFHKMEITRAVSMSEMKLFLYKKYKKLDSIQIITLKKKLEEDKENKKIYYNRICEICGQTENNVSRILMIIKQKIKKEMGQE